MKKLLILSLLLVSACSSDTSVYSSDEQVILKDYGVLDVAENDCENTDSVKVMLKNGFKKENIKQYCGLIIDDGDGVNELIDANLKIKDIQKYIDLDYFHAENVERYLAYSKGSISDNVLAVNMNLDLEPYEITNYIEDDSDYTMLINKYNALPEGYIPSDLVAINATCTQGKDYSCQNVEVMELREVASNAYDKFVAAAKKKNINIIAIAAYRSYEYQAALYNYYADSVSVEYADSYYARPGQSEHNSGLAIDITFNDYPFNEIETKEGYDWILKNMHKYGFILRYPEEKQNITQYGYESWHIRYVGKKLASELYEKDLTLEEYYGMK